MKPYAIFILILFMCSCAANRKHSTVNYDADTHTASTNVISENVQQKSIESVTTARTDNSKYRERIITVYFDTAGRVISREEKEIDYQTNIRDTTTTNRNDNVSSLKNDSAFVTADDRSKAVIVEDTQKDNRPVQGLEWLYVVIVAGVVLLIAGYFIYRKFK